MSIRAALLSAPAASGKGLYLRIDELADVAALTDCHVPSITACDLESGVFLWIPDERVRPDGAMRNEYGGAFWSLPWLRQLAATRTKAEKVHAKEGLVAPEFRNAQIGFLIDHLAERGLLKD